MKRLIAIITAALLLFPVGAGAFTSTLNSDEAYESYTLFVPIRGKTGDEGETEVYLVDMDGELVHSWEYGTAGENFAWLEPDGTLWMRTGTAARPGDKTSDPKIIQMNQEGEVLWEASYENFHHDFAVLPSGNVILIAWEKLTEENADFFSGNIEWTDKLVELDANTLEEVWSWSAQEELDFSTMSTFGKESEVLHTNAVEYLNENPFTGEPALLISSKIQSTIHMIEYPSGEVLWEFSENLEGQHDPTFLENGNILIFNNGKKSSEVLEVDPLTNEVVWSYDAVGFASKFISGAQRLENGNTFITEGDDGHLFEVNSEGDVLWDMTPFTEGGTIFRAYKYSEYEIPWLLEDTPLEIEHVSPHDEVELEFWHYIAASSFILMLFFLIRKYTSKSGSVL
jgi:outer membrane protein assembly factor BamB